jgi:hypothetical protein
MVIMDVGFQYFPYTKGINWIGFIEFELGCIYSNSLVWIWVILKIVSNIFGSGSSILWSGATG